MMTTQKYSRKPGNANNREAQHLTKLLQEKFEDMPWDWAETDRNFRIIINRYYEIVNQIKEMPIKPSRNTIDVIAAEMAVQEFILNHK
jgi:hypothetical protein